MDVSIDDLARFMQESTGKPFEECLAYFQATPPAELEAMIAKAKELGQAWIDAYNRGENMAVELPPGRRP